jgi:hypothetical protein
MRRPKAWLARSRRNPEPHHHIHLSLPSERTLGNLPSPPQSLSQHSHALQKRTPQLQIPALTLIIIIGSSAHRTTLLVLWVGCWKLALEFGT